jgi:hypothetical protein
LNISEEIFTFALAAKEEGNSILTDATLLRELEKISELEFKKPPIFSITFHTKSKKDGRF